MEKLCLQWNDFQESILSSFKDLRQDKDFTDVTLACEDGQQVEAHKIVLTSLSPFFKSIFSRNNHQRPIFYMRGVKLEQLLAILDFLYCGEANVYQEQFDSFLAIADELKLKGLTGEQKEQNTSHVSAYHEFKKESLRQNDGAKQLPNKIEARISNAETTTVSLVNAAVVADLTQLDEQIRSMMDETENFITRPNGQKRKAFICRVCEKELGFSDMTRHIEAIHITGVTHSYDICGNISRSRNSLRQHVDRDQKMCFRSRDGLRKHKQHHSN